MSLLPLLVLCGGTVGSFTNKQEWFPFFAELPSAMVRVRTNHGLGVEAS